MNNKIAKIVLYLLLLSIGTLFYYAIFNLAKPVVEMSKLKAFLLSLICSLLTVFIRTEQIVNLFKKKKLE
jgi:lipopolysaccharide export LptBFGC system permease protein LptF